eukprot:CAMPEP_0184689500 /NCGR_PEP_ID=MMETSP0312-20130426/30690_1 /TAXON_ID=31354 /ORGANISM="Compsopogon coeruleus, Strain SAG 36.94" /LENGTH=646 /DNA_ID=CAMNT_0027146855 /DNA_START=32 /DNA_END=1969 /DNA_ORIENTATION=+
MAEKELEELVEVGEESWEEEEEDEEDEDEDSDDGKVGLSRMGGASIVFRGLTIEVPVRKPARVLGTFFSSKTGESKEILSQVSGVVEPGELVFLMGPSGSGKTTFLDVLADRISLRVEGEITVNGKPRDLRAFREISKYVPQDDDLYPSLTVRETLEYATEFYSDTRATLDEKNARIEEVLAALALKDLENVKSGGLFFHGLSNGQRRRLSVGVELTANPRVLMLDEPTSGIDSASALNLVRHLRELAHKRGMTVIISIHQPAKALIEMADKLFILSQGRVVYFGPPCEAQEFFETYSGEKLPTATALGDWILRLINADFPDNKVELIGEAWTTSAQGRSLEALVDSKMANYQLRDPAHGEELDIRRHSRVRQCILHTRRTFINFARDPGVFWLRMGMYFFLAFFFGLAWWQIGKNNRDVEDRLAGFWLYVSFYIFMACAASPAYIEEKRTATREYASRAWSMPSYMLGHFLAEVPFILLNTILAGTIIYWMQGLRADGLRFAYNLLVLFTVLLTAESVTYFCSVISGHMLVALALNAMLNGMFMAVGGYLRPKDEIGWWLRWMDYSINHHYWTFNGLLKAEFSGITLEANPDGFPPRVDDLSGDEYLQRRGLITSNSIYWIVPIVNVALALIIRVPTTTWAKRFW